MAIGNVFTVTVNNKSVSFTATAATVANVTAGLVAALAASTEPEFLELTAADSTTQVTLTGPADGTPFTQTSSATGGTATLITATPTAAAGPNNWNVAANWSGGAVPVNTDDVWDTNPDTPPIRDGLNQSAVTLANLLIAAGKEIGRPPRNPSGYSEYRETHLRIGANTITVGRESAPGAGTVRLDSGGVSTSLEVHGGDVLWKGATGGNVINAHGGTVGLATLAGESATVATLRVGGDVTLRGGPACVVTAYEQTGGEAQLDRAPTTSLRKTDGTLTVGGLFGTTTVNNDGGTLFWEATGTAVTMAASDGGRIDLSRDPRPKAVTTLTLHAGSAFIDPGRTAVITNPVVLQRCAITDVELDFGTHITLAVAAGA